MPTKPHYNLLTSSLSEGEVQENDIQNKNDVLQADYVKANGLGGSMVWAMDLDDIHGVCGFGKNPLMSKLKEVLTWRCLSGRPINITGWHMSRRVCNNTCCQLSW
jgi:hypothetical protein